MSVSLARLAWDNTRGVSFLSVFCMNLAALDPYYHNLGKGK